MSRDHDQVTIDGATAIRATAKALLCRVPDGTATRDIWIPQSQISEDSGVYQQGDEGMLVITAWFAEREGLD